jgi:hypothetical protein
MYYTTNIGAFGLSLISAEMPETAGGVGKYPSIYE